jgi:hypothetical protein
MTPSTSKKGTPLFGRKTSPVFAPLFMVLFMSSTSVKADLAEAMECHKNVSDKTCSALLIGHIDALKSIDYYCPDGKTSYGFLQQAWARDLAKDEGLQKLGTTTSLRVTIERLNLRCKK